MLSKPNTLNYVNTMVKLWTIQYYHFRTQDDQTPLELATINGQNIVVEELCKRGVDMAVPSSNGDPILWLALTSNQEDIASTLVK